MLSSIHYKHINITFRIWFGFCPCEFWFYLKAFQRGFLRLHTWIPRQVCGFCLDNIWLWDPKTKQCSFISFVPNLPPFTSGESLSLFVSVFPSNLVPFCLISFDFLLSFWTLPLPHLLSGILSLWLQLVSALCSSELTLVFTVVKTYQQKP